MENWREIRNLATNLISTSFSTNVTALLVLINMFRNHLVKLNNQNFLEFFAVSCSNGKLELNEGIQKRIPLYFEEAVLKFFIRNFISFTWFWLKILCFSFYHF